MDDATMQVITNIVLALIAVSLPPLIGVLVLYIKSKLNLATQEKIRTAIGYAVDAAELLKAQNGWTGEDAKQYVIDAIVEQFPRVNRTLLETIIESCVAELKTYQLELVKDPTLGVVRVTRLNPA
jgi:hypothetical protein